MLIIYSHSKNLSLINNQVDKNLIEYPIFVIKNKEVENKMIKIFKKKKKHIKKYHLKIII